MAGLTFVLPGLWPTGGYRTLAEWANRTARLGVRVTVVSPTDGPARSWLSPEVRVRTASPARLWAKARVTAPSQFRKRANLVVDPMSCRQLIPDGDEVVLGFAPYSTRALGVKPLVTYMQHWESIWFEGDAGAKDAAERRMLAARRGIVNSSWLLSRFPAEQADRLALVFPGVNLSTFSPGEHAVRDGPLRIAALGRDEPFKGLADLRVAAATLPKPVELVLFGTKSIGLRDGPVAERHLGQLPPAALAALYRQVDIVCTPSWYESFPLPPLEAMACGALVVTSRQGTEDYAVDNHNAFVFEGGDVDGLAATLSRAVASASVEVENLRAAARATAESFSWEAGHEQFVAALRQHGSQLV